MHGRITGQCSFTERRDCIEPSSRPTTSFCDVRRLPAARQEAGLFHPRQRLIESSVADEFRSPFRILHALRELKSVRLGRARVAQVANGTEYRRFDWEQFVLLPVHALHLRKLASH